MSLCELMIFKSHTSIQDISEKPKRRRNCYYLQNLGGKRISPETSCNKAPEGFQYGKIRYDDTYDTKDINP
jgi:hypothetical protein